MRPTLRHICSCGHYILYSPPWEEELFIKIKESILNFIHVLLNNTLWLKKWYQFLIDLISKLLITKLLIFFFNITVCIIVQILIMLKFKFQVKGRWVIMARHSFLTISIIHVTSQCVHLFYKTPQDWSFYKIKNYLKII